MSNVNLLPYDYFARRLQQRMTAIFVVLFMIIMTCVIVAALALERNGRRTLQAHEHIRASYEEAARLIELMQRLEAQRATMLKKAKLSAALLEKVPRSYLLAFVTNARPENVSLIELEIVSCRVAGDTRTSGAKRKAPKSAKRSTRTAGETFDTVISAEITGLAVTDVEVAKFIAQLARNPLTDVVDLVYSKEKEVGAQTLRQFRIKWQLKRGADVFDMAGLHQPKAQGRRDDAAAPEKTVGS